MTYRTRIQMLESEFHGWAKSAGFVCRRAYGHVFYGTSLDGEVRVELVDDGVALRDRYMASWKEPEPRLAPVENVQCSAADLDGLFAEWML